MKKAILFALFLGGSGLTISAQTNADRLNIISTNDMKSKKTPVAGNEDPKVNSTTNQNTSNDPTTNGGQYLEYKVDQGINTKQIENDPNEPLVTQPIQAEGYTDPNYELNKQKSAEVKKQLEAPAVIPKTREELISDLQAKIKAIKDGEIMGPDATTKLPVYEKELESLLNTKPTKSCVSE